MFNAFTRWKERANLVEEQLDCIEHKLDMLIDIVRANRPNPPHPPKPLPNPLPIVHEEEKALHVLRRCADS